MNVNGHVLEMDERHRYHCHCETCDGRQYESVTTVIGRAVPKNLAWYGQTVGLEGVAKLARMRVSKAGAKYDVRVMDVAALTEALKRERLTVNHSRDRAADRGTAIHAALEAYATEGVIPNLADYPEHQQGYIRGLAKFILRFEPEFLASEVRVLSVEHGYAGTFDLLARIKRDGEKVFDPKRPGPASPVGEAVALIDLKTSKWVYPSSHFPQLEAYEGARVEMGEEPSDVRAVLWITQDGHMDLVPSTASFEDFLALKASGEVIRRLESSYRRPKR